MSHCHAAPHSSVRTRNLQHFGALRWARALNSEIRKDPLLSLHQLPIFHQVAAEIRSVREHLSKISSCPKMIKEELFGESSPFSSSHLKVTRGRDRRGIYNGRKMWHLAYDSCSDQILAYTRIKTRVSTHQKLSKISKRIHQPELSPGASPDCSRGRTASGGHFLPSRTKWQLQPTPLMSTYVYGVYYAARSPHLQMLQ